MKVFSVLIVALLLLALAASAVLAKDATVRKEYPSTIEQRAKAMHTRKTIMLRHPEKMARLQKQYLSIRQSTQQEATVHQYAGQKYPFYQKARQHSAFKHDCPYHMGAATPSAKSMHAMKRDHLQRAGAHCCTEGPCTEQGHAACTQHQSPCKQ